MAKKNNKEEMAPQKLFYIFYSKERWDNWLNSLSDLDFDGTNEDEMPEGYRALNSFMEDITIAVLKVVRLYQNNRFSKEEAAGRLRDIEEIVMAELPEGRLGEIILSVQLSLRVLFVSSQKYLEGSFDKDIKSLVKKGRKQVEEDPEGALDTAAQIGAGVIDGATCCDKFLKDDAGTLFDEWLMEIETMRDDFKSLKNFDEAPGEEF
ncbi:MAG: DUF2150 family protein [Methanomicrobiales archaeon]|nr:DUF2150 family protein [Methanomicrobiales archaeon]